MPEHTCSPAQSREGPAASRLLLLIPRSSQPANIPGVAPRGLGRIRPSPGHREGVQTGGGRSNNTHMQGKGWAWLKGEGGAPSNGNSNRSCTNGSLITINYHFRLRAPPLNHRSAFFVPPPFIQPRTFRRTKGRKRRITNGATNPPAFGRTIWQRGCINYRGF